MQYTDVSARKKEYREKARAFRKSLCQQERLEKSAVIMENLKKMDCFKECDKMLVYVSLPDEIDTMALIEQMLSLGKRVYCPLTTGDTMEFYEIGSISELQKGNFNVLEPVAADGSRFDRRGKALMVLPGLAFDKKGNRLGYGKGYYDKYLSDLSKTAFELFTVGLCYEDMLLEQLPAQDTDYAVDWIVTESAVYSVS